MSKFKTHAKPTAPASTLAPTATARQTATAAIAWRPGPRRCDCSPAARSPPAQLWLPWGLTLIALATAGLFGYRAYRLAPQGGAVASDREQRQQQIADRQRDDSATGQPAAGTAAKPAAPAKSFSIPRAMSSRPTKFRSARKSAVKSSGSIRISRKGPFTKRATSWPRSTR